MSPLTTCMRLLNSCACARRVSVVLLVRSSSRWSSSISVRSRIVATQPMWRPRLRTGIRLTVSTRPRTGMTWSVSSRRVPSKIWAARPVASTSCERAARGRLGYAEQVRRLVVDHGDPLVEVDGEHALLDAVQQGLALLDEAGDLARLEAERLPLDPPGEQQRPEHPEQARDPQVGQQVRHRGGEVVEHRGIGPRHRDDAVGRAGCRR